MTQNNDSPAVDMHPLDAACRLERLPDGLLQGNTHIDYGNMVGPFGGAIAATILNAALSSPQRLGDPVALTVNFAGPITDGPFLINARATRTNRSTQHWTIELTQGDAICTTATAVFAIRRETWTSTEISFPAPPAPESVPAWIPRDKPNWPKRYQMRFVGGPIPDLADPSAQAAAVDSTSALWIRDEPPRALDFLSLAALSDAFFPRIFIRRPRWTPIGTISLTTYFHACGDTLTAHGSAPVFGAARAQHFGKGYFDQSAELWSPDGTLLANSHQIVYYKE